MPFQVYYGDCTTEQPDYVPNLCGADIEHGRVRSGAFIRKSYLATLQANATDAAVWRTGILDKNIIILAEISGSYDGGSPVDGPGYGDQENSLTGYKHVVGIKDPNYKGNAPFYNTLKFSRDWAFAWRTETQTNITDVAVQVVPKAPVTDDVNSEVVWDVEIRFSQPDIPTPFDTPEGVFIPFAYA